jgi:FkbM family methyltransferase
MTRLTEPAPSDHRRSPRARPLLRAVPAGLGRVRLTNYAYRAGLRDRAGGGPRTTRLRDGSLLDLNLADWPQARAFLLGDYDVDTVRFVAANLPADGVFLDVGAHIGLISFQVLRQVPSARIHAFEPHPDRNAQYRRNIDLNDAGDRVKVNAVALSDSAAGAAFDLRRHAIDERGTEIQTTTLDDYVAAAGLDRIDVLKLDVEGHELSVLRGAERALGAGRIRSVTLEAMDVHGDTTGAAALLESRGYRRVGLPSSRARALRERIGAVQPSANAAYELP